MRIRGKAKSENLAIAMMSEQQKRAIELDFENARCMWEARKPEMEKQATAIGRQLVAVEEYSTVWIEGRTPVMTGFSFGYTFKRFPITPKSQRVLCGAKTRSGGSCQARVCIKANGVQARRCRLHGGLSTGPKSKEGRAAVAAVVAASNRTRKKGNNAV